MKEGLFYEKQISIIITKDAGLWHLSLSHPSRLPVWDEIKNIRYKYLPNELTFSILLPPKEEYVNLDPNCFHLWQIP